VKSLFRQTCLLGLSIACSALFVAAPASAQNVDRVDRALDRLSGLDESIDAPFTCGTPDILEVEAAWPELREDQRQRFHDAIGVPADEARGGDEERGGVPCFYELPNSIESDHFVVYWGNSGSISDSVGQYLLDALEDGRIAYLDGTYAEPFGNPDIKVPFYLGNSGSGAPSINFNGGYTTVCTSYQHAFVVLSGIDASASTADVAIHELFHAVQMGSPDPYPVDSFYWESSAVWAEDFARPELNIYQWFLSYYANNTWLAMDYEAGDEVGFMHQYAMFILPVALDEWSPGGPAALAHVWNGSGGGLIERLETSWVDQEIETSFAREFGRFTAHASVMDFEDQAVYTRIPAKDVLEPPAEVEDEAAPQRYGSHYYRIDPSDDDVDAGNTKIRVHLDGGGPAWVLALNRSTDGDTALPTIVVSDSDGQASIEAIDVGTLYSEAWVVVSSTRNSSPDYTLTVELIEQTEDPGSDLEPPGDDDDDDDDGPRGVDCSGTGIHPFGYGQQGVLLGLLFMPLLFRRRR
jgi:hypothetical protein